jgi:hypothetical protein
MYLCRSEVPQFSKSFSLRSKTQQGGQPQSHGSLHSLSPGESHQRHASDSRPDRSPSTHSNQADMSASMANESGPGPLGLNVVYSPETERKVDIVFIHGLGGSSRWTWSKNKHPDLFWPLTFLPLESVLCRARILSFGYNANFRKSGNASTVVLDFAKELLFDLKFAKDERNEDLRMGSVSCQPSGTSRK